MNRSDRRPQLRLSRAFWKEKSFFFSRNRKLVRRFPAGGAAWDRHALFGYRHFCRVPHTNGLKCREKQRFFRTAPWLWKNQRRLWPCRFPGSPHEEDRQPWRQAAVPLCISLPVHVIFAGSVQAWNPSCVLSGRRRSALPLISFIFSERQLLPLLFQDEPGSPVPLHLLRYRWRSG